MLHDNIEGGMGREVGGRFTRVEIYVSLPLVHVNVWQKPTQYCTAIILQLKINTLLKKKMGFIVSILKARSLISFVEHTTIFP